MLHCVTMRQFCITTDFLAAAEHDRAHLISSAGQIGPDEETEI